MIGSYTANLNTYIQHLYLYNYYIFFVDPGVTVTRLEATVGHPTKRSWSHCGCNTMCICYGPEDAELAVKLVSQLVVFKKLL